MGLRGRDQRRGALSISGTTISDNQADGGVGQTGGYGFGGAISLPSPSSSTGPNFATLTMTNSVLIGNQAVGGNATGTGFFSEAGQAYGGAIEDSTGSSVTLAGCTFSNNQALAGSGGGFNEAFGGAISSNSSLVLSISGSTFTGNEAVGGAGPAVAGQFAFFLSGGGADGGAISSVGDPLVLTGSTFKNNQAIGGNCARRRQHQRRRVCRWRSDFL